MSKATCGHHSTMVVCLDCEAEVWRGLRSNQTPPDLREAETLRAVAEAARKVDTAMRTPIKSPLDAPGVMALRGSALHELHHLLAALQPQEQKKP